MSVTIKAGTYRFNDTIEHNFEVGRGGTCTLKFTFKYNFIEAIESDILIAQEYLTQKQAEFEQLGREPTEDELAEIYAEVTRLHYANATVHKDVIGYASKISVHTTPNEVEVKYTYDSPLEPTAGRIVYRNGWYTDLVSHQGVKMYGDGIREITFDKDVSVDDDWGYILTNSMINVEDIKLSLAEITYNGETIAQLNAGETCTIKCGPTEDTKYVMASDVVVKVGEVQSNGTVIPPNHIKPSGSLTITENGTYDVTDKAEAVVDVPQFIDVEALPTENISENTIYRLVNGSTIGAWRFKENPNLESFPTGRINFKFSLTYYSIYVDICYGLMAQLGDLCALTSETGETSYRILHTEEGTWASEQEKMFYVLENITNETTLNYINKIADKVDYPLYRYVNGVWVYYSNPYYYINGALTEHPSSLKFGHYVLKNRTNPSLGSTIYGLSMATLNCHFFTYIKVNGEVKLVECKDITVAEGTGDSQGVYKILYGVYEGKSTLSHCEVYSTTDEWVYDKSQNIYVIEADEDAIIWLHTHGIKLT